MLRAPKMDSINAQRGIETRSPTSNRRHGPELLFKPAAPLIDGIERSVGAAEINDPVHDQRRGKDCADVELPVDRNRRGLAPARGVEHRLVEFAVGGKDPAFVLFRRLGLVIPEWRAGLQVTRLQGPVEDSDKN